jgi:hypothetical protein
VEPTLYFEVLPEHLRLLRHLTIGASTAGTPTVDMYLPYGGNYRSIPRRVAQIVGGDYNEALPKPWLDLHAQVPLALKVLMRAGEFTPGVYERTDAALDQWRLLDPDETRMYRVTGVAR